jgi:UDP-GlcNAc:undecaprenyl-phosphate GlcNAc-1-phosphate transferase
MIVPLLALSIPLLDVSLSVLRRFLRNRPIFSADKGHIHHRLLDRGLSPRQAVLVLYLVAALAAAFALLATTRQATRYQGLLIAAFCVAAWFGIRKLRYAEFDFAGQLLFGGAFTRAMDRKLKLAGVASALDRAADAETWWSALASGGKTLGLIALRWEAAEGARSEVLREDVRPAWSLRVAVSETDSIEVEGGFGESTAPFDLVGFAEILSRTFVAARDRGLGPASKSMAAAV